MFVSVKGRVIINVEALNMTESVGNYVKHRRVPMISPTTYATYFVPAISGESIAHGFQKVLAEEAKKNNKKVCKLCEKGIFLKSTNENVFKGAFGKDPPKEDSELEKIVIGNCLVEDVGGFLYAYRGRNVKRTSNFSTGYMIPVKEALESVVIEPQLHSRYALGTPFVEKGTQGQMIYYVEISSAPYVFSFDLDTKYIGKLTFSYEKVGEPAVDNNELKERVNVTLESLKLFLIEMMFGAKKTRFLPVIDWESIVIAVSNDVWTVPSPLSASYISNTLNKFDKINGKPELFVYINPMMLEDTTAYVEKKTEELLESFYKALEEFKKKIEGKGDANLIDWNEFKRKKLESFLEKKVNELIKSSDLKYASNVQEIYAKAKARLEEKRITIYESFEECVSEAVEKAREKVS